MKDFFTTHFSRYFACGLVLLFSETLLLGQNASPATDGIFDARNVQFATSRVALSGQWKFYPNRFISSTSNKSDTSIFVTVPSLWTDLPVEQPVLFGTYVLDILLPASTGETLALEIPQVYNSYLLFISDSLAGRNGTPASDKASSIPQWRPQVLEINAPGDTLTLILQVSGFHHAKSGIREPLYLGLASDTRGDFRSKLVSTLIEVTFLSLLGGYFIYDWCRQKRRKISLYFALFCLSWATREFFSDVYPISQLAPDINWPFIVKTEYISLFLIMIFATSFLNKLFPDLASQMFKYLLISLNVIYILFTLLTPTTIFTQWLTLYLCTSAVTLAYAAITIVRAWIYDKNGAWALMLGLFLIVVTAAYDLFAYRGTLANNITVGNIAYCIIFCCCTVGLLQHLDIIKSGQDTDNKLTYRDLYR